MTKMLLTIISCVFLCAACSEDGSNYYDQQIDELYNRVITAENEIFDLQTQSEENNAAESDAEEINTTDVAANCHVTIDDSDYFAPVSYAVEVTLYAQLDDVLKWNDVSENYCKNAGPSCTQKINVLDEYINEDSTVWCDYWTCIDNECTAMTSVYSTNCDVHTVETVTQFYSATHKPCRYTFDEISK